MDFEKEMRKISRKKRESGGGCCLAQKWLFLGNSRKAMVVWSTWKLRCDFVSNKTRLMDKRSRANADKYKSWIYVTRNGFRINCEYISWPPAASLPLSALMQLQSILKWNAFTRICFVTFPFWFNNPETWFPQFECIACSFVSQIYVYTRGQNCWWITIVCFICFTGWKQ